MAVLLQQERSRSNREVVSVEEMSQGQGTSSFLVLSSVFPRISALAPKRGEGVEPAPSLSREGNRGSRALCAVDSHSTCVD